ncbi:hypothetical protein BDZ85DRAFT_268756 [Elsinoe ampelina]|uniref:Uncharacterized protein n=1 Tax=Elsinoe ampelina TaxID=302913 RepID=A0A6A6G0U6_9PEZI|nr:hypothetical protein BDZ85DRAFT_268756 [Elsinoe ampelina]
MASTSVFQQPSLTGDMDSHPPAGQLGGRPPPVRTAHDPNDPFITGFPSPPRYPHAPPPGYRAAAPPPPPLLGAFANPYDEIDALRALIRRERREHLEKMLRLGQESLDERMRHVREMLNLREELEDKLYDERRRVRDWAEYVRQERNADEKAKRKKSAKKEERADLSFFRTPTRKVWPPPPAVEEEEGEGGC